MNAFFTRTKTCQLVNLLVQNFLSKMIISVISYSLESMGGLFEGSFLKNPQISQPSQQLKFITCCERYVHWDIVQIVFKVNLQRMKENNNFT